MIFDFRHSPESKFPFPLLGFDLCDLGLGAWDFNLLSLALTNAGRQGVILVVFPADLCTAGVVCATLIFDCPVIYCVKCLSYNFHDDNHVK